MATDGYGRSTDGRQMYWEFYEWNINKIHWDGEGGGVRRVAMATKRFYSPVLGRECPITILLSFNMSSFTLMYDCGVESTIAVYLSAVLATDNPRKLCFDC